MSTARQQHRCRRSIYRRSVTSNLAYATTPLATSQLIATSDLATRRGHGRADLRRVWSWLGSFVLGTDQECGEDCFILGGWRGCQAARIGIAFGEAHDQVEDEVRGLGVTLPARIASTIAGARKFNRITRDIQESLTPSRFASVAMSVSPLAMCDHHSRALRSSLMSPASGMRPRWLPPGRLPRWARGQR